MNSHAWILLGLFLAVLLSTVKPMGLYIAHVMAGRFRFGGKIERPLYRLCGIKQDEEMGWLNYAFAILLFNLLGVLAGYPCNACKPGYRSIRRLLPVSARTPPSTRH
jgi:K+-transporting ATPase ATPase A chain